MKIRFNRSFNKNAIEVFVWDGDRDKRYPYKITIEKLPCLKEHTYSEPSCEVDPDDFEVIKQALFDGLQQAGMFPKNSPAELELAAVRKHLEDMRGMVGRLLGGVLRELESRTPQTIRQDSDEIPVGCSGAFKQEPKS